MSIELNVERLVIDEAVPGKERAGTVRAAIERELAQRLAQTGAVDVLAGIGTVDRLSVARLPSVRDGYCRFGERIAAAVGQGLGLSAATRYGSAAHYD